MIQTAVVRVLIGLAARMITVKNIMAEGFVVKVVVFDQYTKTVAFI